MLIFEKSEKPEDFPGRIVKVFGGFPERLAGFLQKSKQRQGRIGQLDKRIAKPRLLEIMTILVPPAILHEAETFKRRSGLSMRKTPSTCQWSRIRH